MQAGMHIMHAVHTGNSGIKPTSKPVLHVGKIMWQEAAVACKIETKANYSTRQPSQNLSGNTPREKITTQCACEQLTCILQ